MSEELPEGWAETTLRGVLAVLESGSRPRGGVRGIHDGIPSLGGEHLTAKGGFDFSSIRYVPHSFYAGMNRGHFRRGDVLVVKDGATTGKVSLVREDFPFDTPVVNEHVFICRPAPDVDPAFLFWLLWSSEGQRRILENFQGSAQGGINQSFADGTLIPIAPLAEQLRIVAAVEAHIASVNAARERLKRLPAILERFRQAVLGVACGGKLTEDWRDSQTGTRSARDELQEFLSLRQVKNVRSAELRRRGNLVTNGTRPRRYVDPATLSDPEDLPGLPHGWTWTSLDALSTKVVDGVHKTPTYVESGVPFVTVRNLTAGAGIDLQHLKFITEQDHRLFTLRANPERGDLLISKDGTLGVVRAVRTDTVFSIFVSVALVKPVVPDLTDYLELALSAPQVQARMVRTGTGLQHLHLRDLKAVPIPLPSLEEQREIVRRVRSVLAIAESVELRRERAKTHCEKLIQSILAKAFRGELVPTEAELARAEGRSYEPADLVLERIREPLEQPVRALKGRSSTRTLNSRRAGAHRHSR